MMAGNPSWYPMFPPSQQPSTWLFSSAQSFLPSQCELGSSSLPLNPLPENHELPQSWSQLLFGGFQGDEDKLGLGHYQCKKLENWEDPFLNPSLCIPVAACLKQEVSQNNYNLYTQVDEEYGTFQAPRPTWSHAFPASSPRSCVASCNSNSLDFSYIKGEVNINNPDQSSECNSSATGGMSKKARVQAQPSTSQPPLKVRKEKLGDRITTLHQLVSPFGKTDTASVLLEAIGYIRFLQGQIEALCSPYLGTASSNIENHHPAQGERDSLFSKDLRQDSHDHPRDLRSKGLCLVPITCAQHFESEFNGAEFWDLIRH